MNDVEADDRVLMAWGEWVGAMGEWDLFGTLTYRQGEVGGNETKYQNAMPAPEAVVRHVKGWLREGGRRIGRPVEAAVVGIEAHKSGWPHCHALVRLPGGLQYPDVQLLGQTWYERRGYAKLEAPKTQHDVCLYVSKYVTKDLARGDVLLWPSHGPMDSHQLGLKGAPGGRRAR